MADGVRRVIPLTFGWEHIPKSISVHGADPTVRLREPVPGVLLEVDGGWFLLDTGFNTPILLDQLLRRRMVHMSIEDELVGMEGDAIEAAFAFVDVDPADVVAVAVSHLHYDHAGGIRWFSEHAPIHCQQRELEDALTQTKPEELALCRIDFDDSRIDWRLADGDVELAPGITAVATYGHTIGHQSFVVDLADGGGFVFAFDAADLTENIEDELAPGHYVDDDEEQAIESIRRLKTIAAEKGYPIIPGHDPVAWPRFTEQMGVAGPTETGRFLPAIPGMVPAGAAV
jgi:glyoxylase-like metal-dependent hydrolase (beta-lactamase superfamily II)